MSQFISFETKAPYPFQPCVIFLEVDHPHHKLKTPAIGIFDPHHQEDFITSRMWRPLTKRDIPAFAKDDPEKQYLLKMFIKVSKFSRGMEEQTKRLAGLRHAEFKALQSKEKLDD